MNDIEKRIKRYEKQGYQELRDDPCPNCFHVGMWLNHQSYYYHCPECGRKFKL